MALSPSARCQCVQAIRAAPDYHGNITARQPDLDAWVERVWRAGIQPNCHINGDVAIDNVSELARAGAAPIPEARRAAKVHARHARLSRAHLPHEGARCRAGACFTSYAYYNPDKFNFYGDELMEHMMPYRSLPRRGNQGRAAGATSRLGHSRR